MTRETRPYGLASWWLQPGKVITDPIHGDIFVTRLEQILLDTPPMQRLRRVRQLGTTHIAYPGATHTRFSHSLGAVQVVQTLLDAVINQRNRNNAPADLFADWETQARQEGGGAEPLDADPALEPDGPTWRLLYRRWLAEATVLARLGALLHDIGHLPFGHTIEDDLRVLTPHDENRTRFEQIWKRVLKSSEEQIDRLAVREERGRDWKREKRGELQPLRKGERLYEDLMRLVLTKEKGPDGEPIDATKTITYPFVVDMVGNTICADLLDYLQRDHTFSGLPISLGQRYISSFYITPSTKAGIYKKRMALLISRAGRERKDIVTEILKHLRYRYELQERVLVHHTKLASDAMVGKMIELWLGARASELGADQAKLEASTKSMPKQFSYPGQVSAASEADRAARFSLEELFLNHGDDGVLERIGAADQGPSYGAAADLASMLLDRTLYKPAANALRPAAADGLFKEFGTSEERRKLEREASRHAGLKHDWHVVLWVPDPEMRLKLAELLVDDGKGITQFKDKSPRGSDIYDAHKDLWTISVFVHPTVTTSQARAALAKLAQLMGISWDAHREELGNDPDVAPQHLAAVRACKLKDVEEQVGDLVRLSSEPEELAARGGEAATQDELDRRAKILKRQLQAGR
jgi:HD superfamily phosphohydrolase